MTGLSGPSSHRRGGFTLIEVMAALVLIGTILAAVTIARGRFLRQWADAERQLGVTRAADALLAEWMAGPPTHVPRAAQGPLAGSPGNYWRTRVVPSPAATQLGAVIVRLDVIEQRNPRRPILSIDFLLADPPRLPATTTTVPAGGGP